MSVSVCNLRLNGSLSTGKERCTQPHLTTFPVLEWNDSHDLRRTFTVVILFILFTQPSPRSLPHSGWCPSPTSSSRTISVSLRDPAALSSTKPQHLFRSCSPSPILLPISHNPCCYHLLLHKTGQRLVGRSHRTKSKLQCVPWLENLIWLKLEILDNAKVAWGPFLLRY